MPLLTRSQTMLILTKRIFFYFLLFKAKVASSAMTFQNKSKSKFSLSKLT